MNASGANFTAALQHSLYVNNGTRYAAIVTWALHLMVIEYLI